MDPTPLLASGTHTHLHKPTHIHIIKGNKKKSFLKEISDSKATYVAEHIINDWFINVSDILIYVGLKDDEQSRKLNGIDCYTIGMRPSFSPEASMFSYALCFWT